MKKIKKISLRKNSLSCWTIKIKYGFLDVEKIDFPFRDYALAYETYKALLKIRNEEE